MDQQDSYCPYLHAGETTAKGTGLAIAAAEVQGKKTLEFGISRSPFSGARDVV